jgi:cell division septum initiation protein DivIVA
MLVVSSMLHGCSVLHDPCQDGVALHEQIIGLRRQLRGSDESADSLRQQVAAAQSQATEHKVRLVSTVASSLHLLRAFVERALSSSSSVVHLRPVIAGDV